MLRGGAAIGLSTRHPDALWSQRWRQSGEAVVLALAIFDVVLNAISLFAVLVILFIF